MHAMRNQHRLGKTLGAGAFGIVRTAEADGEVFAVKILNKREPASLLHERLRFLCCLRTAFAASPHSGSIILLSEHFENNVQMR